jgi:ABC-type uncharacterized transport system substrate-binding protein
MKKMTLSRMLSILLLLMILGAGIVFNVNKPRVMVLHSYHPSYAWTREVNKGLTRGMERWTDYSVRWHYMDTKKHNDKEWLEKAELVALQAIEKWDPHVIIAIDDLAQSHGANHFLNHPTTSIVFAGVNGTIEPYGYHEAKNVVGIFERKQWGAVKEALLIIEQAKGAQAKRNARLGYIVDASTSMKKDRVYVHNHNWKPLDFDSEKNSIMVDNYPAWQRELLALAQRVDYILVANYRKLWRSDEDKSFVPAKEVMQWTEENAKVPVIGVNVFNVEDGAMLSVGVSPYEQGETAAKLTEGILEKKLTPANMPVRFFHNSQYIIAMRKSALERRNLKLPTIYESFSRATANYIE